MKMVDNEYHDIKRNQQIFIRITPEEKKAFLESAELAGIPLSSWIRERLRLASIRELENAGRKIPFVKPIHIEDENK
jgi:hypothetical protein